MDFMQHVDRNKMVEWRRHLHKHPELAFQEKETSAYIIKALESLPGIDILRPTETSVIGVLKGSKQGKVVGFRADIDALPMQEAADVEFKSVTPGVARLRSRHPYRHAAWRGRCAEQNTR